MEMKRDGARAGRRDGSAASAVAGDRPRHERRERADPKQLRLHDKRERKPASPRPGPNPSHLADRPTWTGAQYRTVRPASRRPTAAFLQRRGIPAALRPCVSNNAGRSVVVTLRGWRCGREARSAKRPATPGQTHGDLLLCQLPSTWNNAAVTMVPEQVRPSLSEDDGRSRPGRVEPRLPPHAKPGRSSCVPINRSAALTRCCVTRPPRGPSRSAGTRPAARPTPGGA